MENIGYSAGQVKSIQVCGDMIGSTGSMTMEEADSFIKGYTRALMEFIMYIEYEKPAPWMEGVN